MVVQGIRVPGILQVRWRWWRDGAKEASPMTAYAGDGLELSRDRIAGLIERGAQERRGVSARRLVRSYRRGRLQEPGEVADLLVLADLLPDDDAIVAPPRPRRRRARR
jgi:hypothetical protein